MVSSVQEGDGRVRNSFDQGERPWGRQFPRLTFRSHPQMLSLIDEAHAKIKMNGDDKDEDDDDDDVDGRRDPTQGVWLNISLW